MNNINANNQQQYHLTTMWALQNQSFGREINPVNFIASNLNPYQVNKL